ncbi:MAG TPA: outer membrane beta-barrel protein [Lacibacter sp.]|nr:outer membrane beta-barrel protein [Lacibacter sp.]HMO87931.1 outer membrane beta-barrel protein [Lacibacter sp.]
MLLLASAAQNVQAQREINLPDHENKPYYFGITLSGNSARFHALHHPQFLSNDSVNFVNPVARGGFGLGLLGTLRLVNHLEARFNPHLIFANRSLVYNLKYPQSGDKPEQEKLIESIYWSMPVQLKFSSDRIGNFRVYLLGGGKYEYDLASNSQRRRAEDLVKLVKGSFGYEAGLGFHFYFPSFILSPEIKLSNTFRNVHSRDPNLIYSNVLDRMQARMIVFSIHLEG